MSIVDSQRGFCQDNEGNYKEKLEIKNCEKRTLFGSSPFEENTNWKLDDLCDIEYNDEKESQRHDQNTVSQPTGKGKSFEFKN